MRILAVDSSGLVASVAIVEDDEKAGAKTLAEYTVNHKKTHSQTLLPMLDEIVKMIDFPLDSLDAIAVAGGPGSFTGLRIGSATAKGLGLALGKPLVHIPTLEALAYNLWGTDGIVCPIMDARRNQVYTGIYKFAGGKFATLMPQTAVGIEELAEKLCTYNQKIFFLGDGVPVHRKNLIERLMASKEIMFVPAHMAYQRAASVGAIALEYFRDGKFETAAEHKPDYLRPSQAERERVERETRLL